MQDDDEAHRQRGQDDHREHAAHGGAFFQPQHPPHANAPQEQRDYKSHTEHGRPREPDDTLAATDVPSHAQGQSRRS